MISHFAQKSPKNTPNFRHIAQRTSVHPFVHIVQWSGISQVTPKNSAEGTFSTQFQVQRAHFWLNSIQVLR